MTVDEALSKSTGFIDMDGLTGYLPFSVANFLVGTGKYMFWQASCWGYVVKRAGEAKS